MNNINPKEYYQKVFEELLQEIKENSIQVKNFIIIKK